MARMYGSEGEKIPLFRINLGRMSGPTFSEEGNREHQPVVFSGHFKVQTPCRGMGVEKERKISANPVLPKGEGVDIISFVCTSKGGHSSAGRALASQAKGRGSESRRPLQCYQRLREFLSEPIFFVQENRTVNLCLLHHPSKHSPTRCFCVRIDLLYCLLQNQASLVYPCVFCRRHQKEKAVRRHPLRESGFFR